MKKKDREDLTLLFNAWIVAPEVRERIKKMFISDLKSSRVVFKTK